MRLLVGSFLAFITTVANAHDPATDHSLHDREIRSGAELFTWCEQEARASFADRGIGTYQWTGRHVERGNTLQVEGSLRADVRDVPVTCTAARGARERQASIRIDG